MPTAWILLALLCLGVASALAVAAELRNRRDRRRLDRRLVSIRPERVEMLRRD